MLHRPSTRICTGWKACATLRRILQVPQETDNFTAQKARWEQEVIKAKQMTEAEQRLGVAEFDRKTAEQRKQESILLGQGEAERRRLVMEADSALEVKIAAWKEVNKYYLSKSASNGGYPRFNGAGVDHKSPARQPMTW